MFNNLIKIDKKFLLLCVFGIFFPILYSWFRIFWIASDSMEAISMASSWIYISIIIEIFSALIILPLFSHSKKNEKSPIILISILILIILIIFILLLISPWLLNDMYHNSNNLLFTHKQLRIFIYLAIISSSFAILERFLIAEIIVDQNSRKGVVLISMVMILKISIDLILISPFSPINFNIINIAISSLISTIIIIFILLTLWWYDYFKYNYEFNISYTDLVNYYQKGFYPGLETGIRNVSYIFITLAILNNLPNEDAFIIWNYGGWIYWMVILQLTNSLRFVLISERINNNEIDKDLLTKTFILIDLIIFITLTPLLIYFILPTIILDDVILRQSTTTALTLVFFMFLISAQGKLTTKFITENKYKYIFINTLIINSLIYLPIKIMMISGIEINFTWNEIIFNLGISLSFTIALIQFNFTNQRINIEEWIKKVKWNLEFV